MSNDDRPTLRLDGPWQGLRADGTAISPQPPPTSPRIKALLSRALTEPEGLSPPEVQEMAASVVYHLAAAKNVT